MILRDEKAKEKKKEERKKEKEETSGYKKDRRRRIIKECYYKNRIREDRYVERNYCGSIIG